MATLSIELMKPSDIDEVMVIERLSFPSPWHPNSFLRDLHSQTTYYIVARLQNKLVGYAGMWTSYDEAHITTLAVHPSYRRRKIGEKLLVELIEEAVRKNKKRMTLEVRRSNLIAQNLYYKYGFKSIGIRRAYYLDNGEDAIIMEINDLGNPQFTENFMNRKKQLENTENADSGDRNFL